MSHAADSFTAPSSAGKFGALSAPAFCLKRSKPPAKALANLAPPPAEHSLRDLYRRLAAEHPGPFILAVSEQFNLDEAAGEDWDANIYRFKKTPLPAEVVKRAAALMAKGTTSGPAVNTTSRGRGKSR